jgi:hypothetical protein
MINSNLSSTNCIFKIYFYFMFNDMSDIGSIIQSIRYWYPTSILIINRSIRPSGSLGYLYNRPMHAPIT